MAEYKLLDTQAFENFINSQNSLQTRYSNVSIKYKEIVRDLTSNLKGRGADAFREDSEKVMRNITSIQDILTTMCNTLSDCIEIFSECDISLGNANRDSIGNE